MVLRPVSLTRGFKFVGSFLSGDDLVVAGILHCDFFEGKSNGQSRSGLVAPVQSAAKHFHALPHASQAVTLDANDNTLSCIAGICRVPAASHCTVTPAVSRVALACASSAASPFVR